MKKDIVVLTYGTFDVMHYGHIFLLQRCKLLGTKLIVGVSTDDFCLKKGKNTVLSQDTRMKLVSELKCVDEVILEHSMQQKISDVIKYKANYFVLGSDYKDLFPKMPEYSDIIKYCKVIFLERTPDISSSQIKNDIKNY